MDSRFVFVSSFFLFTFQQMSGAFQKIVAQNLKAPEDTKAEIEKEKISSLWTQLEI